ncbi:MAG: Glutathione-dependent formaldehyde-activating enzyme [Porticoccaceae bacterium UBA1117]|nr:MAG: Glutathione-dependent formaldehyde-activating enzyme [Porticoccaceae bacterium UBA1117]
MITGRCECQRITFQVDGEINDYSHCHCSQCRRLHGAAFASYAGVDLTSLKYLSGQSELSSYASSDNHRRLFCKNCGSNILVALTEEPDALYLAMGVIDGNPKLPPAYHIFMGSKAPWYEWDNRGEQYDTFPEE